MSLRPFERILRYSSLPLCSKSQLSSEISCICPAYYFRACLWESFFCLCEASEITGAPAEWKIRARACSSLQINISGFGFYCNIDSLLLELADEFCLLTFYNVKVILSELWYSNPFTWASLKIGFPWSSTLLSLYDIVLTSTGFFTLVLSFLSLIVEDRTASLYSWLSLPRWIVFTLASDLR